MYCRNCGSKLKENAKFCGECGWKIEEEEKLEVVSDIEQPQNKKRWYLFIGALVFIFILVITGIFITKIRKTHIKDRLQQEISEQEPSTDLSKQVQSVNERSNEVDSDANENFQEEKENSHEKVENQEEKGNSYENDKNQDENEIQLNEQETAPSVNEETEEHYDDSYYYLPIKVVNQSDESAIVNDDTEFAYWIETAENCGINETITIENLEPETPIDGIEISPLDFKNFSNYIAYGIPTEIVVQIGEMKETVNIKDIIEETDEYGDKNDPNHLDATFPFLINIEFSQPAIGDEIIVTIKSVRKGTIYSNTCKTAVAFFNIQ